MWKMFNETNAIEVMALQFRFAEPLNTVLARRSQSELDTATSKRGLIDRIPMQGFKVNLANPAQVENVSGTGMLYQRTSLDRNASGVVEKILTAQVEYQPSHLTYQTWRYSNWAAEREEALEIVSSALSRAMQGASLSAIRVEYLDRLYYDADDPAPPISDVLNSDSDLLAKHIFKTDRMWHSHTGRFETETEQERRLLLVNADLQAISAPSHLAGRTCIQLVTAAETQYPNPGFEFTGDDVRTFLVQILNDLHNDVLRIFADVLNPMFAEKNDLPR